MFGSGQRASQGPIDEIRQMLEVNALAPPRDAGLSAAFTKGAGCPRGHDVKRAQFSGRPTSRARTGPSATPDTVPPKQPSIC